MASRREILLEEYRNIVRIEARTTVDMIRRQILPAVSAFAAELCRRSGDLKAAGVPVVYEKKTCEQLAVLTNALLDATEKLEAHTARIPEVPEEALRYYHDTVLADMAMARKAADQLEAITDEKYWPFPVYSELLFSE